MPKSAGEQRAEFDVGIVAVHKAFAEFENAFAIFLLVLLRTDGRMAQAIYFAPNSTEARINIVNAVVEVGLHYLPEEMVPRFLRQWRGVMKRAGRCREIRNAIIHGQVMSIGTGRGEKLRLTPLMLDRRRMHPMMKTLIGSGQLPGMSAHDLLQNAAALDDVTRDVFDSTSVFSHAFARDPEASLQTLLELEARHPTVGEPGKPMITQDAQTRSAE